MSRCFYGRTSATCCPVLVHWSSGRRHPPPLPVSCPKYSLLYLTRQHCVVVAPGYRLLLLLSATGGPAVSVGSFRLLIPHQACMDTPLPEVHLYGDPRPDFRALRTLIVFVSNTWAKTRGLSGFQLRSITPCHSMDIMAAKRCPQEQWGTSLRPLCPWNGKG